MTSSDTKAESTELEELEELEAFVDLVEAASATVPGIPHSATSSKISGSRRFLSKCVSTFSCLFVFFSCPDESLWTAQWVTLSLTDSPTFDCGTFDNPLNPLIYGKVTDFYRTQVSLVRSMDPVVSK